MIDGVKVTFFTFTFSTGMSCYTGPGPGPLVPCFETLSRVGLEFGGRVYTPDEFDTKGTDPIWYSEEMWTFLGIPDGTGYFNSWARFFLDDVNTPSDNLERLAFSKFLDFNFRGNCSSDAVIFAKHPNVTKKILMKMAYLRSAFSYGKYIDYCKLASDVALRRLSEFEKTGEDENTPWTEHIYEKHGFKIKFPSYFKVTENERYQPLIEFQATEADYLFSIYIEQFNYSSFEDFKNYMSSNKYDNKDIIYFISSEEIINGIPAFETTFDNKEDPVVTRVYFWLGDGNIIHIDNLSLQDPIIRSLQRLE